MTGNENEKGAELKNAIRTMCSRSFGILDQKFLCQSLGILEPKPPLTVPPSASIDAVLGLLRSHRIGCVVVVDDTNKLIGIFSERDFILKLSDRYTEVRERPVSEFMTPDPVAEGPDTTVAYALNLMSLGGFRHLPIVDAAHTPVGIISVKDVVDHMVSALAEDLMGFEPEEGEK